MIRKLNLRITLPGLAVFVISFFILLQSLAARNAYEILLSSAALFFWATLFFAANWGARKLKEITAQLKPPFPLTAASKEEWLLSIHAAKIPRFFRLHFYLRGKFYPEGGATSGAFDGTNENFPVCRVRAETSFSRKETESGLEVVFPLGGIFHAKEFCRLKDIFGFFSINCGAEREQTLYVRNAPIVPRQLRIETRSGAEDRRNKNSADEERYYMREYTPGDRLRDINWKSSERIETLITRISPDNQDKVTRIEIYFRNYGPRKPEINELWLLDRAKARLAWFLRNVKEEKQSYVFHVISAGADWELETMDDIEAFLDELAALPFFPPQNENPPEDAAAKSDYFVFSTACDAGLNAFLLSMHPPSSLFITQNRPLNVNAKDGTDLLRMRDFFSGSVYPAFRWRKTKRAASLQSITDYAEIGL